ncbi:MAG: sigma-54 dependent transcriptional regulator [Zoogloeaceae bacterium]|jgi:two-component system response regulator PilR (NtrC family)|nr:sigma-54 dependent transcriptional regulator [Zoogloeaceae bacterium]
MSDNKKPLPILVVDDEADLRELASLTLLRMGLDSEGAESVKEAMEKLDKNSYSLCLTDMRLPDGDGLDIVRAIAQSKPNLPVAVITAYGSADNAVAALKAGAFDYLAKPVGLDELRALVKSALKLPGKDSKKAADEGGMVLGESPAMHKVDALIDKLAASQAPVYISGESGTGKEVAARQIHLRSRRASAAFVPVNCGAIPETLMEAEFFGHVKGAYTGADTTRDGFFQTASGGTLFLDEVADLPLSMQVKLLRAIQEKKVRKVGSPAEEAVDARIICATHKDLKGEVDAGRFRQDLYYRINVIELAMPPLRERREDILPLAQALLRRLSGDAPPALAEDARMALLSYDFPGNVRELENMLERALALSSGGKIGKDDLFLPDKAGQTRPQPSETLDEYLARLERAEIEAALVATHGNRTAAAKKLGISFRSIRYRLERLGMNPGSEEEDKDAP